MKLRSSWGPCGIVALALGCGDGNLAVAPEAEEAPVSDGIWLPETLAIATPDRSAAGSERQRPCARSAAAIARSVSADPHLATGRRARARVGRRSLVEK